MLNIPLGIYKRMHSTTLPFYSKLLNDLYSHGQLFSQATISKEILKEELFSSSLKCFGTIVCNFLHKNKS